MQTQLYPSLAAMLAERDRDLAEIRPATIGDLLRLADLIDRATIR